MFFGILQVAFTVGCCSQEEKDERGQAGMIMTVKLGTSARLHEATAHLRDFRIESEWKGG